MNSKRTEPATDPAMELGKALKGFTDACNEFARTMQAQAVFGHVYQDRKDKALQALKQLPDEQRQHIQEAAQELAWMAHATS